MKTTNIQDTGAGIVIYKTLGHFRVQADGETITCTLATSLLKGKPATRTPTGAKHPGGIELAVGDEVRYVAAQDGKGQIVEVLPRRSQISRRGAVANPGGHAAEQVLVANIDQAVPVFAAANPTPHWNMLDRYLVTAESYGLPAVICVTKMDLLNGTRAVLEEELDVYRRAGYAVHTVSSFNGEGLDEIRQVLQGRVSVLLGKSGVGKTSLLNAIQPGLGMRVSAVNQVTGKGRHTTTAQEMFPLDGGGAIVDTPGEREFGLWDVEPDEIAHFFPEMRPHLGRCRFGVGCRHNEEPGCAVRQAVVAGQIHPRRYQSYLRLREDG
jgi:ribosome biogenesis GTPase